MSGVVINQNELDKFKLFQTAASDSQLIYTDKNGNVKLVNKAPSWIRRVVVRFQMWREGYYFLPALGTANKISELVLNENFKNFYKNSELECKNLITSTLGSLANRFSKNDFTAGEILHNCIRYLYGNVELEPQPLATSNIAGQHEAASQINLSVSVEVERHTGSEDLRINIPLQPVQEDQESASRSTSGLGSNSNSESDIRSTRPIRVHQQPLLAAPSLSSTDVSSNGSSSVRGRSVSDFSLSSPSTPQSGSVYSEISSSSHDLSLNADADKEFAQRWLEGTGNTYSFVNSQKDLFVRIASRKLGNSRETPPDQICKNVADELVERPRSHRAIKARNFAEIHKREFKFKHLDIERFVELAVRKPELKYLSLANFMRLVSDEFMYKLKEFLFERFIPIDPDHYNAQMFARFLTPDILNIKNEKKFIEALVDATIKSEVERLNLPKVDASSVADIHTKFNKDQVFDVPPCPVQAPSFSNSQLEEARSGLCAELVLDYQKVQSKIKKRFLNFFSVDFYEAVVLSVMEKHSLSKSDIKVTSKKDGIVRGVKDIFENKKLSDQEKHLRINSLVNQFVMDVLLVNHNIDFNEVLDPSLYLSYLNGTAAFPGYSEYPITDGLRDEE
jgi:hypothetical protein